MLGRKPVEINRRADGNDRDIQPDPVHPAILASTSQNSGESSVMLPWLSKYRFPFLSSIRVPKFSGLRTIASTTDGGMTWLCRS